MSASEHRAYARNKRSTLIRVIILMPEKEIAELDAWGVPEGMESRTAAIRALIRKGLETSNAPAAGHEA